MVESVKVEAVTVEAIWVGAVCGSNLIGSEIYGNMGRNCLCWGNRYVGGSEDRRV
jgi:hypothetical protein